MVLDVSDAHQHRDDLGAPRVPGERVHRRPATPPASWRRRRRPRASEAALEFRGVPYRDSVPIGHAGALVGARRSVSQGHSGRHRDRRGAGAGGLGAGLPASARPPTPGPPPTCWSCIAPHGADLGARLPERLGARRRSGSIPLERLRVADSVAQAARDARARRTDSLAALRRDTTRADSAAAAPPRTVPAKRRRPLRLPPRSRPAAAPRRRRETPPDDPGPRQPRCSSPWCCSLLVALHFYVRPRLWGPRVSPDFLLVGLMLFAMRSGPGVGASPASWSGSPSDALTPGPVRGGRAGAHGGGVPRGLGRGPSSSPTTCWSTPASSPAGVWLRDLIVLVASGSGDQGRSLTELAVYSPLQALTTALFALRDPARPSASGSASGWTQRMNGFDPTGCASAPSGARWILALALPGAGRRVLPDPDPPARQVPAAGGDQPAPPDAAARRPAARSSTGSGRDHRRERAGLLGQAARAQRRLAARGAGAGCATVVPLDSVRDQRDRAPLRARRATSRRSCSATPRSRPSRGWRSIGRVLPGLVIQSEPQAALSGRQGGGAPGRLRVRGDRGGPHRQPLSRRRAGLDRGQGGPRAGVRRHAPGRGGRALHRGERARPAWCGRRRARPRCAPTPGQPIAHHDRPRPPAVHRQHLARRASAAPWSP